MLESGKEENEENEKRLTFIADFGIRFSKLRLSVRGQNCSLKTFQAKNKQTSTFTFAQYSGSPCSMEQHYNT